MSKLQVFPARAGVILETFILSVSIFRLSRTSGGDPNGKSGPPLRYTSFPHERG